MRAEGEVSFANGTAPMFFRIQAQLVTANVRSTFTPSCFLHANFGARTPRRTTKPISTYGRATLMEPEPPQFDEPWQAEALALSLALMQGGRFSSTEWAASLGSTIQRARADGDPDDGSTYYKHVLDALEQLVLEKSLATPERLISRKDAWRAAYARAPHGRPVVLDEGSPRDSSSDNRG